MSKRPSMAGMWSKAVILVAVTLVAIIYPALVVIFLTPAAVYYIWNYHDRIKELESRLNISTKPPGTEDQPV